MMHTRSKQRGGRRATHVLPATLGAALLLPSLAFAAVHVPPQPAAAADEAGPTWPGPWSRAEIQRLIVAEAVGNGTVPAPLALAVADVESDFVQRTVGNSGTVGVMQLHPDVAKSEFGADADALRDPVTNIRLGLRRLARLHERYDGDWELALSHFRGGELAKKGRTIPRARVHPRLHPPGDKLLAAVSARSAGACLDPGGERSVALRRGRRSGAIRDVDCRQPQCVPPCGMRGYECVSARDHNYPAPSGVADRRCDDTVPTHRPAPFRFSDGGGWSAVESAPPVRYHRGGRWIPVTGDGSGRFR